MVLSHHWSTLYPKDTCGEEPDFLRNDGTHQGQKIQFCTYFIALYRSKKANCISRLARNCCRLWGRRNSTLASNFPLILLYIHFLSVIQSNTEQLTLSEGNSKCVRAHNKEFQVASRCWEQPLANIQQRNGGPQSYSCKKMDSSNNINELGSAFFPRISR